MALKEPAVILFLLCASQVLTSASSDGLVESCEGPSAPEEEEELSLLQTLSFSEQRALAGQAAAADYEDSFKNVPPIDTSKYRTGEEGHLFMPFDDFTTRTKFASRSEDGLQQERYLLDEEHRLDEKQVAAQDELSRLKAKTYENIDASSGRFQEINKLQNDKRLAQELASLSQEKVKVADAEASEAQADADYERSFRLAEEAKLQERARGLRAHLDDEEDREFTENETALSAWVEGRTLDALNEDRRMVKDWEKSDTATLINGLHSVGVPTAVFEGMDNASAARGRERIEHSEKVASGIQPSLVSNAGAAATLDASAASGSAGVAKPPVSLLATSGSSRASSSERRKIRDEVQRLKALLHDADAPQQGEDDAAFREMVDTVRRSVGFFQDDRNGSSTTPSPVPMPVPSTTPMPLPVPVPVPTPCPPAPVPVVYQPVVEQEPIVEQSPFVQQVPVVEQEPVVQQVPVEYQPITAQEPMQQPVYQPSHSKCTPQCKWTCATRKCDEECHPICDPPRCQTRCQGFDTRGCHMECDTPHCAVVCPKFKCPTANCPMCQTTCSKPMCKMQCNGAAQPCRSVCEAPKCKWQCQQPKNCPKPSCKMECEPPKNCMGNTYRQLPPMRPGEVAVKSFDAPGLQAPAASLANVESTLESVDVPVSFLQESGIHETRQIRLPRLPPRKPDAVLPRMS